MGSDDPARKRSTLLCQPRSPGPPQTHEPPNARCRFQRAPQRGQHGRRAQGASIPTHEPIGKPTAWPVSRPRLNVPRQSNLFGQLGQRTLLLPQVPQSRQPTGTLGGGPQALSVRRCRRSMPCLGARGPLGPPLVTPPLQSEQKRRGTGTLNHQETLPFPTPVSIRTVRETGAISTCSLPYSARDYQTTSCFTGEGAGLDSERGASGRECRQRQPATLPCQPR